VVHTLNTILEQGGFFYRWIEHVREAEKNALLLEYLPAGAPKSDPMALDLPAYIRPETLSAANSEWQEAPVNGEPLPVLKGSVAAPPDETVFSFDVIANVYFHLNRVEESAFTHPDQVPPDGSFSILNRFNGLLLPLTDRLTDAFTQWLHDHFKARALPLIRKTAWPEAQRFGLALTHDVDFTRAFHPVKKYFFMGWAALKRNRSGVKEIQQADRDAWGFDRLLSFYETQRWPATFFFLAKYLEGRHLRYRIRSLKMRLLLFRLKAGHEIALHPSRYAFEHPFRYKREKARLARAARTSVYGMRHHYLRGLFPALWKQAEELGLSYDATLIYRSQSGFRAGTCRPYIPANLKKTLWAVPTLFFENTLPEKGMNVNDSLQVIDRLLGAVKKHRGLFTVLWHTNHFFRPKAYARIWQALTERLAAESPFIATVKDHTHWQLQRGEIRAEAVQVSEKELTVHLQFPPDLRAFALELPRHTQEIFLDRPEIWRKREGRYLLLRNPQKLSRCRLTVRWP
jgi:peptidoglycan/xylan/chitin deacetylase (PgdA/CDA1 family)